MKKAWFSLWACTLGVCVGVAPAAASLPSSGERPGAKSAEAAVVALELDGPIKLSHHKGKPIKDY